MNASPSLSVAENSFLEIPLAELPATIGRAGDAQVTVMDRWVSRHHCRIERAGETVVVRDLGSSHGTFVNGHRVDETELKSGDQIGVGLTSFVTTLGHHSVTLALSSAG